MPPSPSKTGHRRARRQGCRHARWPGAGGPAGRRHRHVAADGALLREDRSACRRGSSMSMPPHSGAAIRSWRWHAAADAQRRAHRRHLRRSLRHARDGHHHHGADRAVGRAGGRHHDRLCHLGDRLRLRGGDRHGHSAGRIAGRPPGRRGPAVLDFARRAAEAAAEPGRAMRPDLPRHRLLCRDRRRQHAQARRERCATSAMAGRSRSGSLASAIGGSR